MNIKENFYIKLQVGNKRVLRIPIPECPYFVFWVGPRRMEFGFNIKSDILTTPTIFDLIYFISKRIKIEHITRIIDRKDCFGSVRIEYKI
jgi:hypothetical protein